MPEVHCFVAGVLTQLCESTNLFLFFSFQNRLGYFEPLQYHMKFKSSLSVSAEIGIFYSIALNLQADLGYSWGDIYVSQITRVWYHSI